MLLTDPFYTLHCTVHLYYCRESNWVEEEEDPEYSFPPDEEDLRLKDPEELRDDRATKVRRNYSSSRCVGVFVR